MPQETSSKQDKKAKSTWGVQTLWKGYLNKPEATIEAFWEGGWLRSGDVGVLDEDGYLTIVDRLKDLIITGGENVYPREAEEAIYLNDGVAECSVIVAPDKAWGEARRGVCDPENRRLN